MSLKTAKEIWDYLKSEYEGDERIRGMKVLNLIRDFELQKMKESESVKEYSNRLLSIANKVRLLGSVLNDSRIVEKLLVTLPEKFEATITTLENTKDLSKISLTELLNALQAQEQRRSMRQEGVIEGALLVKHQDSRRYKSNKNFKNQLTYGDSFANYQKTKGGGFKKSYPPCRHCEKKGHPPYKFWRKPDAFYSKCNQLGHEAVICKAKDLVKEVDAQLLNKGYKVLFENKRCLIKDASGKDLFNVKMKGKSFALNPTAFISRAGATGTWHKRLGHFHHRGLFQIQSKKLVEELTDIDDDMSPYRACNFGKQHRQPLPKQAWRGSKKLQLVHADLCGPQRTPSLNDNLYYIAFINELTRKCWIFLLKQKSEVAGVFWKFKAKVEKESACLIQTIRSDNSKEYTLETFNRFCEETGIEHQLTASYTPQQNDVSERRNRFIMEMTRCMLHEKDLPKRFWGKATNTIMCLQNRISTKVVKDPTPFEVWYGYKPSSKFVRVFGCLCFIYIPQVKRDKLDKKSEVGIFVGMLEESKDERQDALVDDAPVRGGAFSDREKQNLGTSLGTS
ncbi:uncharacterized protein LOC111434054 [Cucurbita moschata]|uniref:Uncharacterized protein LOC111434054 n=1 Tax=Cucurbita moschata TaxID=3662 RepID=A0A6J1EMZ3_CUCMO|nr:uncharacterized protein LOC111434054 [Cucurbita moschata]